MQIGGEARLQDEKALQHRRREKNEGRLQTMRVNQKERLLGMRRKKGRGGPSNSLCSSSSMWIMRRQRRRPG